MVFCATARDDRSALAGETAPVATLRWPDVGDKDKEEGDSSDGKQHQAWQYAVRTSSKAYAAGYYSAILVSSQPDLER